MHRLYKVAQMLRAQPVAILPRVFAVVDDQLSSAIVNGHLAQSRGAAEIVNSVKAQAATEDTEAPAPGYVVRDGVAIVPMYGICGRRLSALDMECGGVDVDTVASMLREADADERAQAIVLDIDSPGGSVSGVSACAEELRNIAKPVVAYTDGMCASAAYWIGSQALAIVCGETAEIGSVGVYCAILDESVAYDKAGRRVDVIASGEHKGAGVPGTSLTEAQRAEMQSNIDALAKVFKDAVMVARPNISPETLDGRVFVGEMAVVQGFADQVGTLADAIELAKSL